MLHFKVPSCTSRERERESSRRGDEKKSQGVFVRKGGERSREEERMNKVERRIEEGGARSREEDRIEKDGERNRQRRRK